MTTPSELVAAIADVLVDRGVGLRVAATAAAAAVAALATRPVLVVGDVAVDLESRVVSVGDRPVELRPKEYELLETLVLNAGAALSRADLMATVWDENWFGSTKTLDVTIAALRRRLEFARAAVHSLRLPTVSTLRGHGYRLDPPATS